MQNDYELNEYQNSNVQAFDYREYRRERNSQGEKSKTDFFLTVLRTQVVICVVIDIFMLIMFKSQSVFFFQMKDIYNSFSSEDISFADAAQTIKKMASFNVTSSSKAKPDEATTGAVESIQESVSYEIAASDNEELYGAGGEDLKTAKDNTSFAPISVSEKAVIPVLNPKVTSKFGYRINPVTNEYGFHSGIDLAVPEGSDIRAAYGGTVVTAESSELRGNYIVISHSDGIKTVYCHCKELFAKVGETVSAGDVIASVGMTGQATGPHLHFEIIINGVRCNPICILDV